MSKYTELFWYGLWIVSYRLARLTPFFDRDTWYGIWLAASTHRYQKRTEEKDECPRGGDNIGFTWHWMRLASYRNLLCPKIAFPLFEIMWLLTCVLPAFSYTYVLNRYLPVSWATDLFKVPKCLAGMNTAEYELQVHVTGADVYRIQEVVNIVGLSLQ